MSALLKDRFKATLTVLFLDCCPLILALQHEPLIDLPHTAFLFVYLWGLINWYKSPTWRNSFLCGALLGLDCLSKHFAMLYSVPILGLITVIGLSKKDYRIVSQSVVIGLIALMCLATWVLPNFEQLLGFHQTCSTYTSKKVGMLAGIVHNMFVAGPAVIQSFSPLMFFFMLLCATKMSLADLKAGWVAFSAPILGGALLISLAYFQNPEPRYFGPIMVPLSLVLACGTANFLRAFPKFRPYTWAAILLCVSQALILSFQTVRASSDRYMAGPVDPKNSSPVFAFLGITDPALAEKIAFVPDGDPWKQKWIFDSIEAVEGQNKRYVYLNVLDNTWQYNQGALICMSRWRHSCVAPISWRGATTAGDLFIPSDSDVNSMHWFCLKEGGRHIPLFDQASEDRFKQVVERLQRSDQFKEVGRQRLPDGTDLVLYQNKFWEIPRISVNQQQKEL